MAAASLMALSEATEQAMFAKGVEINTRQLQMKAEVEALTDLKAIRSYVVQMACWLNKKTGPRPVPEP